MNHPLLDLPTVDTARFASLEDEVRTLLGTTSPLVLLQGEATIALEAMARGIAKSGSTVLNVVSGPYGGVFGTWLDAAGAEVVEVSAPWRGAASPSAIGQILEARRDIDVVSLVHAEAATGNKNALETIAGITAAKDVLLVVDAVASLGAEPLDIDQWGIDLCVVGPQKALAGPAGVSAVTVSDRAWEWLEKNPQAPRHSVLSLLDWKHEWIDPGRQSLPCIPSTLDLLGLEAALKRVSAEGLEGTISRHRAAAAGARAGLLALGLEPWVQDEHDAAHVVTTVCTPLDRPPADVRRQLAAMKAHAISLGSGPLADALIRINHTGRNANPKAVADGLEEVFAVALGHRPRPGREAARLASAQSLALDAWERAIRVGR